jgi:hypothetical protein
MVLIGPPRGAAFVPRYDLAVSDRLTPANLEQLRQSRSRPQRDDSIASAMGHLEKQLRQQARNVGGVGDAWVRLVPARLLEQTSVLGMSRGVLTVRAATASARFELDRWLKGGGEDALVKGSTAALSRVKVV